MEGRLVGSMAISNESRQEISQEIDETAMTRMFNLRNVFELVNDGFRNGSFPQEEFVHQRYKHIFHIGTNASNQLDIEGSP